MTTSTLAGILAALVAAFVWSLNFVVPFVIGEYSVFDFALVRFVAAGLMCAVFIAFRGQAAGSLTLNDWLLTLWLGIIGYLGYFLTLVGAAIYAGPVIAPAILALVPIVLAIAGNLHQRTVPWRALVTPLGFVTFGLLLIHTPTSDPNSTRSSADGIALAIAAVALWTWFGLLNQSALARRPGIDAGVWTALIMIGAAVGMLAFAPIGFKIGLFRISQLGLGWERAAPLYAWGIGLALLASIGGALAWTIAAQRVPVALAAQLVVTEAVFGTVLGLVAHRRWPSTGESMGMVAAIAGIVSAIRVFESYRRLALANT